MKIVKINNLKKKYKTSNLIIGHFNVVHKDHLKLFDSLDDFSFLIFDNNPSKKYELYNLEERINNLNIYNPKYIFVFDIKENNYSAEKFINNILKNIEFNQIHVGDDFKFGKDQQGDINLLKKYFNVDAICKTSNNISTKNIVLLLEKGKISDANKLLTTNFYFEGKVIRGNQFATTNFFPTANMLFNKTINIKEGSYISITTYDNKKYHSISFIGKSDTLNKSFSVVETYLFDFEKDIYGDSIKVELIEFIRENKKFDNFNDLVNQINNDLTFAKEFWKNKL